MKKNFEYIPKGKLSDVEKQVMLLKIERLSLERDRSVMILNKGMLIYFAFLTLAILGFINDMLSIQTLNISVIVGLVVLVIATVPYFIQMKKEEASLSDMINDMIQEK